jgi:hypothetical protein
MKSQRKGNLRKLYGYLEAYPAVLERAKEEANQNKHSLEESWIISVRYLEDEAGLRKNFFYEYMSRIEDPLPFSLEDYGYGMKEKSVYLEDAINYFERRGKSDIVDKLLGVYERLTQEE